MLKFSAILPKNSAFEALIKASLSNNSLYILIQLYKNFYLKLSVSRSKIESCQRQWVRFYFSAIFLKNSLNFWGTENPMDFRVFYKQHAAGKTQNSCFHRTTRI